MDVRDAVEADAEALAAIANAPTDVMRNLVHDRTVRVAVGGSEETDPNADVSTGVGDDDQEILGFVSFGARDRTVHVTQLSGAVDACERLLAEPVRFAANENMDVELLVPADEEDVRNAAERVGFDERGTGPKFEGRRTVRYRLKP